ncbi:MAG: bifunctional homocysteine S-methyltransferase/methylenetetrahydrofolate reductase [Gemmatimonadota bacterium]
MNPELDPGAPLRHRLRDGRIHLMDGAMGTLLYERGFFVNVCYDALNLTEPELVEEVHAEYVRAGARILSTNAFGANPVKLSAHGWSDRTEEVNQAAVERARAGIRRAGIPGVLVLGAFGPLGIRIEPWGPTSEEEARGYFGRQVDGLLAGGVDGFLLETFQDLGELHQALRAIRERSSLPVMAQFTVEEGGRTAYGTGIEAAVHDLEAWGVDAIGLNCSVGPVEILEGVERMAEFTDLPVSAQPNAGLPRAVEGRKIYMASPEYMARYARRMVEVGVRFLGGCCGTTPDHIRAMAQVISEIEAGERESARDRGTATGAPAGSLMVRRPAHGAGPEAGVGGGDPAPLAERSPLGKKLAEGAWVTGIELVPPRGWDAAALREGAAAAARAGVDFMSIPDTPRGVVRMAALPAAELVARETGVEVLPNYTCRDRNMLGMISDLMGAAAVGVRNLLVVSGEPHRQGPYADRTAIYDIDSIGLTNVLARLNRGADPGGHPLDPPTRFVVGVALNPSAPDPEREHRRFRWKVEAGADFAVTRPIFDPEILDGFLQEHEGASIPVLAGIWPLDSLESAEFLHNEMPGIDVPAQVRERMANAEARGGDEAKEEGVRIALETIGSLGAGVQGVHLYTARGGMELALRIVQDLRGSRELPVGRGVR